MIVIGEKINSTRKKIKDALNDKMLDILIEEAFSQLSCGAEYIDINTATGIARERDDLIWLLQNIQDRFDCSLSIDSPDSSIVKEAIKLCRKKPFVNSITGEASRLTLLNDFMAQRECFIIILAMDDDGMPSDVEGRVSIAEKIIAFADSQGVDKNNIFIDPLVKPISTEPEQAVFFLDTIKILKDKGIRSTGGLSNVSFGLPRRDLLNAVFIKLALGAGIDAAIIDPTQTIVKDSIGGKKMPEEIFLLAKNAILGRDAYSMDYIRAFREGRLDF